MKVQWDGLILRQKETEVLEDKSGCPQVWGREAAPGWVLRGRDRALPRWYRAAPGVASPLCSPGLLSPEVPDVPWAEAGDGAAGEGSAEGPCVCRNGGRVWLKGAEKHPEGLSRAEAGSQSCRTLNSTFLCDFFCSDLSCGHLSL